MKLEEEPQTGKRLNVVYKTATRNLAGVRVFGGEMKLSLIFALIDITILVAYPFVFLAGKMRQLLKIKR